MNAQVSSVSEWEIAAGVTISGRAIASDGSGMRDSGAMRGCPYRPLIWLSLQLQNGARKLFRGPALSSSTCSTNDPGQPPESSFDTASLRLMPNWKVLRPRCGWSCASFVIAQVTQRIEAEQAGL